ncbi:MAG: sulfate adenylyltransferase, partial [Gammaproteobacteria bacterium]|nr:sulfate adenylyltransferase [Gammaproteobacteria bacterium]
MYRGYLYKPWLLEEKNKAEHDERYNQATTLQKFHLNDYQVSDTMMIGIGAFTPLTGFMCQSDYDSVVSTMRMTKGHVWPLPVVLDIPSGEEDNFVTGKRIALVYEDEIIATMYVLEKYPYDKLKGAKEIFQTDDEKHPGVQKWMRQGDHLLAGNVIFLNMPNYPKIDEKYNKTPQQVWEMLDQRGWVHTVGFQTRNAVHRGHEYIQKCALEIVDGLLLHPLVGETKEGDLPNDVRLKTYETLLDGYYARDRVILSAFPA